MTGDNKPVKTVGIALAIALTGARQWPVRPETPAFICQSSSVVLDRDVTITEDEESLRYLLPASLEESISCRVSKGNDVTFTIVTR